MNKAVYSVIENGKTTCFYTDHAGGYNNALAVLRSIYKAQNAIRSVNLKNTAADLMKEILYDRNNFNVAEELDGSTIFENINHHKAMELLADLKSNEGTATHLILDFDNQLIGFEHSSDNVSSENFSVSFDEAYECVRIAENDVYREQDHPKYIVMEQSLRANLRIRAGLNQEPFTPTPEMKTKAIYSFSEKGEIHHFYSDQAGGLTTPFSVLKELAGMQHALHRRDIDITELVPLIRGKDIRDPDEKCKVFKSLLPEQATELLDSFGKSTEAFTHIMLDLDNKIVFYRLNDSNQVSLPSEFSLDFSSGMEFYNKAHYFAMGDFEEVFPTFYDAMENSMKRSLKEYVEPEPALQMSM